jgi:hypothetical protein
MNTPDLRRGLLFRNALGGCLRRGHVQILANLAGEEILDFGVPGNRGKRAVGWILPDRMSGAFSKQSAAMRQQMRKKLSSFQTAISSSV